MEKIINVCGYSFKATSTAASFIIYKREFNRDAMTDIMNISTNTETPDIETILRFTWVFAKAADKTIKPLVEWLNDFEIPPMDFVTEVTPEILSLISTQMQTTIKPKKNKLRK